MIDLESIEQQIDDLRDEHSYIERKKDDDVFCEGCPAIYTTYEYVGYWGLIARRPIDTCPIDFEPGAAGCHRGDLYEELEDAQAAILRKIVELQSLAAEVFAEEVA